jgi:glycosyltransferase involved in cell wall biosynthesis
VRIAIDARVAAEVPAGRGRYVREILRHFAHLDGEWSATLLGRRHWDFDDPGGRFSWKLVAGGDRDWPLRVLPAVRGHDRLLATSSFLLPALSPVPAVPVVYDFAPFDRRFGAPLGSLFERVTAPPAVRRAHRLVAISQATRDELVRRWPGAEGRTVVAAPSADDAFTPIDPGDDDGVRERLGVRGRYVLSVGTLEPRKNLPRLIEAFTGLPADVRAEHSLVLVGAKGWGPTVDVERELVQALGFVADEELPALYRGATLVAYPSLYEGFGIPVLEGLRCGVAVLTSNTSSMPEVGGDAACYADPEDVASIRAGLAALLSDPAERRRLAAAAPAQAARFDWRRSAQVILDALRA